MGQVGLHAITGLVVGEHLVSAYVSDRMRRQALMFGFVVGNLIPDLDFLSVVAMYPSNPAVALQLHRGFTHSILGFMAILIGFSLAAKLMKDVYFRYLGYGLTLGAIAHATADIFLWFTAVDIFWPASGFGIIPPVNLWFWFNAPPLLERLMGASEFAAFALYYQYLIHLTSRLGTDRTYLPTLQRMVNICWIAWTISSAMAFDLTDSQFIMFSYIPMGMIFLPACFYLTWRLQSTIEVLSDLGHRDA